MNTNKNIKVYLIAGEPSGDLLGSRLMRALRKKYEGNVEFFGLGGDTMEQEGLVSLFDISDLAVMGLVEVIPSIPKVLKRISQTVSDIKSIKPDVVITIDSWSFSARVHKKLKRLKLNIPQMHYVAPQVWAWKKNRAKTMNQYIDCLLTLLPQEAKYFTPYGLETHFVGHPVIESDVIKGDAQRFRTKFNIPDEKVIITVLPGSRHTEVSRLLPVFMETARELLEVNPNFYFVMPTVKTVSKKVISEAEKSGLPICVVETQSDRYDAFNASVVAIAASGTVALELAICNIPHIVAYKVSDSTAIIVDKLLNIQFVNLSNILLGREIIPELLQQSCIPANIKRNVLELIEKKDLYEKQINGFEKVRKILGHGVQTPSENASDIILNIIKEKSPN